MTSNRPLEDWGKLIGDVPSATAILDRFLHHVEVLTFAGKSYRLRKQTDLSSEPANCTTAPTGAAGGRAILQLAPRKNRTSSVIEACES